MKSISTKSSFQRPSRSLVPGTSGAELQTLSHKSVRRRKQHPTRQVPSTQCSSQGEGRVDTWTLCVWLKLVKTLHTRLSSATLLITHVGPHHGHAADHTPTAPRTWTFHCVAIALQLASRAFKSSQFPVSGSRPIGVAVGSLPRGTKIKMSCSKPPQRLSHRSYVSDPCFSSFRVPLASCPWAVSPNHSPS